MREEDLGPWLSVDAAIRTTQYENRARQEREALKAAGFLVGEHGWSVEVTGESHYQPTLERAAGGRSENGAHFECAALLVREPSNRWDKNAVRVVVNGQTVGYISRGEAADVQPLLRKLESMNRPAWIRATVVGGWQDANSTGSFGIVLDDLPELDELSP